MQSLKIVGFTAVLALLPQVCLGASAKHVRKPHQRIQRVAPVVDPQAEMVRGNAALGGNNASSAFGSNSANENANGRTGGGFGS